ncbi:hypothetical protein ACHAXT_012386 [Thalassiosira profunda]
MIDQTIDPSQNAIEERSESGTNDNGNAPSTVVVPTGRPLRQLLSDDNRSPSYAPFNAQDVVRDTRVSVERDPLTLLMENDQLRALLESLDEEMDAEESAAASE